LKSIYRLYQLALKLRVKLSRNAAGRRSGSFLKARTDRRRNAARQDERFPDPLAILRENESQERERVPVHGKGREGKGIGNGKERGRRKRREGTEKEQVEFHHL